MDNIDNSNKQSDTTYDSLNLHKNQNSIIIDCIYDISYLNYKKQLFLSKINDDFNLIVDLFDEDICNILINIHILKKKNKISENNFAIFKFIFDYIIKINETCYMDQENFLIILMDFYKLNNLHDWINNFFEDYIFKELIDYKLLINKINDTYSKLKNNVLIFKILDELNELINEDNMKKKIIYLSHKISFDLFMFYDSMYVYELIITNLTYIINISNENSQIAIKNKRILNIFKTNKNLFLKEYTKSAKKYKEIYFNDIELYIKFKINKNDKNIILDKFIKNLSYINKFE